MENQHGKRILHFILSKMELFMPIPIEMAIYPRSSCRLGATRHCAEEIQNGSSSLKLAQPQAAVLHFSKPITSWPILTYKHDYLSYLQASRLPLCDISTHTFPSRQALLLSQ